MFDLFRRKTAKDFMEDAEAFREKAKENYIVPPMPQVEVPKPKQNDALYMVGSTDDGHVQLRVGSPTSITLTMNTPAVRQLIRQLEAAIVEETPTEEE